MKNEDTFWLAVGFMYAAVLALVLWIIFGG